MVMEDLHVKEKSSAFKKSENTQKPSEPSSLRINPILEKVTSSKRLEYAPEPWQLVECLETGFVYLSNPPGYDSLYDDYAWEKTLKSQRILKQKAEPVRSQLSVWIKKCRQLMNRGQKVVDESIHLLKKLEKNPAVPFQVLDVGCGEGLHGAGIASQAFNVHGILVRPIGIEISNYLAEVSHQNFAKFGGHVLHTSALEGICSLADNSIDLIILMSFLEHELQPAALLKACEKKLTEQGSILIKVPNFQSINRYLRQERWCGFRFPDHVNYFTPSTLKILVRRCGLKIERMNIWDRFPTNDNMWAILRRQTIPG